MLKTNQKKLPIMLTLCLIVSLFSFTVTPANEIMPRYNNVSTASSRMTIDDDGLMKITYSYTGYSSTTSKAVITTYIEKKFLGLFWLRVDIGTENDEWVDTVNNYKYNNSRTYSLSSSGTYRATIVYIIYGSGGSADKITFQPEATY